MRVFLLLAEPDRILFYSEDADYVPPPPKGWLGRKVQAGIARLKDAERHVGRRTRNFMNWLQSQTFPDEPLLRRLRSAKELEVHYPTTLTREDARQLWIDYLRNRKRRHLIWMVVDFIVGVVTIVLAPLPGPNIIQYWFLYRFFCHFHVYRGLRLAEKRAGITFFFASSILDPADPAHGEGSFSDIAERLGFTELDTFLARHKAPADQEPSKPCAS